MKSIIILALLSVSVVSCGQDAHKVKHKKSMNSAGKNLESIKVVNKVDPICNMETAGFTKDTAEFKNKVYGFCSTYCKDEFLKDPEKYVQK
ncbi:YHS domain-containing protein [Chryseobacterium wangxinyae]|uniref:YHS domain-containing protein n=1 Tax=Chryseobacterium sp. CY353 TaxID=2997334 RepID=UPI002271B56C|nr:YHS domain-containing protein [Chryseobacterium sp. CY353]MCY0969511.1 YHS domain-containing protein [Chryseobacterium sp. CY353]